MKDRCNNIKNPEYKNYGERGIKVCEDWLNVSNFFEFAYNNRYKDGLEIDRIDNNKGYYPDNCRFVDRSTNVRNRRGFGESEYKGVTLDKRVGRWNAAINVDGTRYHLGMFETEREAANRYNVACSWCFPNNLEFLNRLAPQVKMVDKLVEELSK
jgi:hypothetical protein